MSIFLAVLIFKYNTSQSAEPEKHSQCHISKVFFGTSNWFIHLHNVFCQYSLTLLYNRLKSPRRGDGRLHSISIPRVVDLWLQRSWIYWETTIRCNATFASSRDEPSTTSFFILPSFFKDKCLLLSKGVRIWRIRGTTITLGQFFAGSRGISPSCPWWRRENLHRPHREACIE